jgi:hypothetical protein
MKPDDRMWLWIVYGLLFVPYVGPVVLVVGSSVLYYSWRKRWPEAAARLNVHAWIAIGINVAAHFAIVHWK